MSNNGYMYNNLWLFKGHFSIIDLPVYLSISFKVLKFSCSLPCQFQGSTTATNKSNFIITACNKLDKI